MSMSPESASPPSAKVIPSILTLPSTERFPTTDKFPATYPSSSTCKSSFTNKSPSLDIANPPLTAAAPICTGRFTPSFNTNAAPTESILSPATSISASTYNSPLPGSVPVDPTRKPLINPKSSTSRSPAIPTPSAASTPMVIFPTSRSRAGAAFPIPTFPVADNTISSPDAIVISVPSEEIFSPVSANCNCLPLNKPA